MAGPGLRLLRLLDNWNVPAALMARTSVLRSTGWIATYRSGMPIAKTGEPIPWITYSSISFLDGRLRDRRLGRVFEYGSGQSTMWLSARADHVTTVEHDKEWFERTRSKVPGNVDVLYRPLDDTTTYETSVGESGERYDLILVDGRRRVAAAIAAMDAVTEGGVIVWDNSERERYDSGMEALAERGWRSIDFTGLGPVNVSVSTTTVFYRPGNVLDI